MICMNLEGAVPHFINPRVVQTRPWHSISPSSRYEFNIIVSRVPMDPVAARVVRAIASIPKLTERSLYDKAVQAILNPKTSDEYRPPENMYGYVRHLPTVVGHRFSQFGKSLLERAVPDVQQL